MSVNASLALAILQGHTLPATTAVPALNPTMATVPDTRSIMVVISESIPAMATTPRP